MEALSYNEEKKKKLRLRHIFFPGLYGFLSEATIAVVALLLFNATELSNRLLSDTVSNDNPISYSTGLLTQSFIAVEKYYTFQQISLFLLWAIFGASLYILIFRFLQIAFSLTYSVNEGFRLVQREHTAGLFHWLSSLHDFFLNSIMVISGVFVLLTGAFVCFGIASQELRAGLVYPFPSNVSAILLSFVVSVISVRFVVLGISLLSARFRTWYT